MKHLPLIIPIYILITFQFLFAQAPDTLWTQKYGGTDSDHGQFVEQTSDDGYIITGWTKSFGAGLNDNWLIKTNSMGDTIWTRIYGGSQDENSSCVRQTSDGGYILFTETYSFSPVYWQVWLIKTDESGDTSWTKLIGGSRHYFVESGQEIEGKGYIFAGYTKASGAGQEDIWVVKTDTLGETIWTKTYGGSQGDLSTCIEQTDDGGYIISALTKSFGSGDYDGWLIKADTTGDSTWSKVYGGTNDDQIYYVQQTSDGGFILAGRTKSFGYTDNYSNVWLIKTDASGDSMWMKTYGGPGNDYAESVQQTSDGGYIVGGQTSTGAWIIKTDSAGDTLWTKSLGWGTGGHIQQTGDGGYIFLVEDFSTSSLQDVWLVKIASDLTKIDANKVMPFPETFLLKQNYPNPCNPSTTIEFTLSKSEFTTLKVYNLLGKKVSTLISKKLNQGNYTYTFDGKNLASGIYYYQLVAGDFREVKKMVLLR